MASRADEDIQLDEAALLIAAEADDAVDVDHYLGELDRLAAHFREDSRFDISLGIPVAGVINYIHDDLGFSKGLFVVFMDGNVKQAG